MISQVYCQTSLPRPNFEEPLLCACDPAYRFWFKVSWHKATRELQTSVAHLNKIQNIRYYRHPGWPAALAFTRQQHKQRSCNCAMSTSIYSFVLLIWAMLLSSSVSLLHFIIAQYNWTFSTACYYSYFLFCCACCPAYFLNLPSAFIVKVFCLDFVWLLNSLLVTILCSPQASIIYHFIIYSFYFHASFMIWFNIIYTWHSHLYLYIFAKNFVYKALCT